MVTIKSFQAVNFQSNVPIKVLQCRAAKARAKSKPRSNRACTLEKILY